MTERKKKLRLIQLGLLIVGTLIIYFTYSSKNTYEEKKIISKDKQQMMQEQLKRNSQDGDTFFNIEYSGIDLEGNRYVIFSKEASNQKGNQEIVNMRYVDAKFYFKDDTILYIVSNEAIYNNKTLDIIFFGDVKADYEGSELFAQKAEYSNSDSFLTISDNVKVKDIRGSMFADKLLFDIKKQTLNIASSNEKKVNAKVDLK